ncbi:uncharacterized protein LOC124115428 isoform X4 [Haliotis rufescens]|uniref:uncharacterized protein LOC124115428 isoform X4 n=1 Tax=Haliotis rufescens TaxID=6454 RepID=UPI00201F338B|nr:uncharacterized protein LOC124115428 isoform X4 [Haliotis rufescens]
MVAVSESWELGRKFVLSRALKFRQRPMKTTWKDLSPTHSKGQLTLGGQIPCDNHVTLNNPANSATITIDGGFQLEQGPVIKMDSNIINTKLEERQVSTLPRRSRNRTKTWKDLSPTKEKNMSSSYGGSPKMKKNEENSNQLVTWKDLSPSKEPSSPEKKKKKKRPESGYFSNDVQSDVQESREGIDVSLSESESGRGRSTAASSPEEGCFNNEYFYDEDFIVQFDTNIRDGSVPRSEGEPEPVLPFPHSLTGSYTRFGTLPDSQQDVFLGPYESELSGSRTSMEISSSEREMMCSSDMLDFSNDPLFTPTPTGEPLPQHFSVDSLGRCQELVNSRSSTDARLAVTCCPRKDEYFLSFNESQSHFTASESEHSYVSQSSSQGGASNSCSPSCSSNGEEAEEICSNSFHFCQMQNTDPSLRASRAYRPNSHQRGCSLGAVQERSIEKSELSDLEKGHCSKSSGSSRSHSCGSLRSPARSPSCYKLSSHTGTLQSLEDMHYSDEVNAEPRYSTYVTSWKHVKNLRKFGKLENMLETSRCNSLPDLSHPVQHRKLERAKKRENLQAMADSFHNKRHSASLLEMYQRMRCPSNPVSPDTMKTVEQILFPQNGLADERFGDHLLSVSRTGLDQDDYSEHDSDICGCGNRGLRLNIPTEVGPGVIRSRDSRTMSPSFRSHSTGMTPDTVVLWQGTKNFASQFPPKTQDCGIQTSIDGSKGPVLLDHSMQTSPNSPQRDFISLLDDVCGHEPRTELKDPDTPSPRRCVSANEIRAKRTKSMPNFKRSASLSPSRIGKNSFYTHNSLPDLSFLASGMEQTHSNSSLFDPVQIPIILRPVIDDSQQTQCRQTGSCSCQGHKGHVPSHVGNLASSSSGVSSTSSCFDPGYVEPRRCASLAADLERILFLPPHLEGVPKFVNNSEQQTCLPHHHTDCQRDGGERKYDRYAYEMHPGNCPTSPKPKPQRRPLSSSSSSNSTSSLHLEGLYAVKEEQSPTSPEKPETGPSWFEQQRFGNIHLRNYTAEELCYGLSDCQDENDSITIEIYEQFAHDRKPLKSCLRKKAKGYRSRSLSNPDSLCAQSEAPPRKPSRHSIACDGIFPQLVDEEQFENANIECIRNFCDEGLPPPELLQETEVNLVGIVSSSSSSFEDSKANKRVSFASEVSFHSPQYSPQCSPKRQGSSPKPETDEEHLTLQITQSDDSTTVQLVPKQGLTNTGPEKPPRLSQQQAQTRDFTPQPIGRSPSAEFAFEMARKRAVLISVSQAAEALVTHFAQARDPFDKLRLGSSAENPAISKLVVAQLCPAIEHVVENGMKAFLTGFHVFGKIHITPWRVAEMSSEIGPYTRAVNELVRQLKLKQTLISNKQKFYAFIIGLLNLRLLDFWMGYVRSKKNIVDRVYNPSAILCLSQSHLQRGYDDMLLALQPLAVLPFQLEFDIVTPSTQPPGQMATEAKCKQHCNSLPRNYEHQNAEQRLSGSDMRESMDGEKGHNWKLFNNATFPRARTSMTNMTTFKGGNSEKKSLLPPSPTKMPGMETGLVSQPVKIIENNQVLDLKYEDREENEERIHVVQSPVSSITNLAAKFLQKTQSLDRGYRNGATEYNFANTKLKQTSLESSSQESSHATQDGRHVVLDGRQSQESMSSSSSQTMMQPKQSPRNSFNIISFFDKLLLPDKMNPKSSLTRNSWTEGQRSSQEPAPEDTRSKSLSPQHQPQHQAPSVCNTRVDEARSVGSSDENDSRKESSDENDSRKESSDENDSRKESSDENDSRKESSDENDSRKESSDENDSRKESSDEEKMGAGETMSEVLKSEDDIQVETTESDNSDMSQAMNNLGLDDKEVDTEMDCAKNIADNACGADMSGSTKSSRLSTVTPDASSSEAVDDPVPNVLKENVSPSSAPKSTRASVARGNRLEVGLGQYYPNVDINANSPDFHPDHYAIGHTEHPNQSESNSQKACQPNQQESRLQNACGPTKSESSSEAVCEHSQSEASVQHQSGCSDQHLKSPEPSTDSSGDSFHRTMYRYVITLVSCDPDDNDHMNYEIGEYLEVLAQLDSDWLYCANGKIEGLVRCSAVQPITDEDMFEQLHDNFYR